MDDNGASPEQRFVADLSTVDGVLDAAKRVARRYRELTGKPLGITGEVAEFAAASHLDLSLAGAREPGFDALRHEGDMEVRVQIKGRRLPEGSKSRGRLGAISLDHPWDVVVLVLLDADFEVLAMHEAKRPAIEAALTAPGSKARNVRGQLSVRKFVSISERVWPNPPSG